MDFYNTSFYDAASAEYSAKRYAGPTSSYVQYFFRRRLKFVLDILSHMRGGRLLEVGCADGVVIDAVMAKYPTLFVEALGTDISPEMIAVAQHKNTYPSVTYALKNTTETGKYDVVLAVGFMSPGIFDTEFEYINQFVKPRGLVVLSLASRGSLYTWLKLHGKAYAKDYWTHAEYEKYLRERYDLVATYPYGFFVPKLWAFPEVARVAQPLIESVLRHLVPWLFHEKLYVVRAK